MRFIMFVCGDGVPASEAEEALAAASLAAYVEGTESARLFGCPVLGPETATTVRVRDGETRLSDGPFVETTEHIVGFDVIECADREEAVRVAAAHPLAWFHRVEVRACDPAHDEWTEAVLTRLNDDPAPDRGRYLMLICVEPGASEPRQSPPFSTDDWVDDQSASGARIVGQALAGPGDAATVRVRGPHTLVSDGPFAEAKEWVAGFDVIECADLDEAVTIAAGHPMAWSDMIEIRPFGSRHGLDG